MPKDGAKYCCNEIYERMSQKVQIHQNMKKHTTQLWCGHIPFWADSKSY